MNALVSLEDAPRGFDRTSQTHEICVCPIIIPIRTVVFGKRVSLGMCVSTPSPTVFSIGCKPRVLKFGTQLKMGKIYQAIFNLV